MFTSCDLSTFNPSSWDVSHITNMTYMFAGQFGFYNKFNGDVSGWNVSSVVDMTGLFSFTSHFNQPLNNWDIRGTIIGTISPVNFAMFQSAIAFNQPLNNWDVSITTNFGKLFNGATSFNQDLGDWDVSSATDMTAMFSRATAFNNGGSDGIKNWDVSSVVSFGFTNDAGFGTFQEASAFNQPIGSWNVGSATQMSNMFRDALSFNQDIGAWDVSNVNTMYRMFDGVTSSIPFNNGGSDSIKNWNTSSLTNAAFMFRNCDGFKQDISLWDINQVTSFTGFLQNTPGLPTANYDALLIAWDAQGAMSYSGTVNFGGSKYTAGGAAEAARTSLISKWGAIIDGGPA
jgi:surface protein